MSSSYKWHTILSGALRGDSGGKFLPVAHITWTLTPGERGSHVMIFPEQFFKFEDAANFAYSEATAWVDRHVDDLTGSLPGFLNRT
jgi:hypothetical protein